MDRKCSQSRTATVQVVMNTLKLLRTKTNKQTKLSVCLTSMSTVAQTSPLHSLTILMRSLCLKYNLNLLLLQNYHSKFLFKNRKNLKITEISFIQIQNRIYLVGLILYPLKMTNRHQPRLIDGFSNCLIKFTIRGWAATRCSKLITIQ